VTSRWPKPASTDLPSALCIAGESSILTSLVDHSRNVKVSMKRGNLTDRRESKILIPAPRPCRGGLTWRSALVSEARSIRNDGN
jgi:hypothetical protein